MPSYQNQGESTSVVFAGKGRSPASRRIYAESAQLFATLIAECLACDERPYVLADIGSYKGELLAEVLGYLPRHRFSTVAVDINADAMRDNPADRRIVADAAGTGLSDKVADVAICRYVLQWNMPDKQRQILRELERISKHAVILQHFGSDVGAHEHRTRIDTVLSGTKVPQLRREDYYMSTAQEIEAWLAEQGLAFQRRSHIKISHVSDSFVDRYNLTGIDARRVKEALGDYDYIVVTTWILSPGG